MAVNLIAAAVAMSEAAAVTKFIVTAAAMVINYDRAQGKAAQAEAVAAAQMAAAAARGVLLNVSGNIEAIPVIYGARKVGGIRTLVEVSGASNEYLHVVLVLGESEISAINDIQIDDMPWDDARFGGLVSIEQHLGSDAQAASAALIADIPSKWTAEHKGSGIAYLVMKFKYDRSAYPYGLPTVTSVPSGRVPYDPRSGLSVFSDNPALVIRDYLTSERYGFGVDAAQVDDASFTVAANYCDEMVDIPGGAQKRYTCVGLVDTSLTVYENMKKLLTSCRGSLVFSGGKYKLVLDKPDDLFLIGGTAQAAASQSLTLAAGVSEVDDTYKNMTVRITSGAGAVQERNVVTSRKNLLTYSNVFSNAIWIRSAGGTGVVPIITPNYGIAPDGTLTASRLQMDKGAGNTSSDISQIYHNSTSGANSIGSVWMKSNAGNVVVAMRNGGGSDTSYCTITPTWTRFSRFNTSGAVGRYIQLYVRGVEGTASSVDLSIAFAQGEIGTYPSEYIHTEANSAVGVAIDAPWSSNLIPNSTSSPLQQNSGGGSVVAVTNLGDGITEITKTGSGGYAEAFRVVTVPAPAGISQPVTCQMEIMVVSGDVSAVIFGLQQTAAPFGVSGATLASLGVVADGNWHKVVSNKSIAPIVSYQLRAAYFQFSAGDKVIRVRFVQAEIGVTATTYIATTGAVILPLDSTSTYEIHRHRFDFTEDNIVGAWEIRPPSRTEKFNRVTATFNNPAKNWQPDLAIQQSIPYRIADGGKVIEAKIDLPFTADMYTAQQIAQQELKQSRFGTNVRFRAFQEGLQCDVGDVVSITHSTPNWTDKAFRVINLNPLDTDEVEVVCREYSDTVYPLDPLALYSPAAAANLPDASTIGMPGNLAVVESLYHTSGSVGVRSRASVSWAAPADPYVLNYELEYRKDSGNWVEVFNIRGTSIDIDDLPVGMYEWRVKTMNVIGVVSEYSAIVKQPIYGLTAAPADVSGFGIVATGGQARATWGLHPDLDVRLGGRILIRWSNLTTGATWQNAVPIGEANGDAMTVMLPLLGGTYLARAEDSTGNLSSADASFGADEALATGWTTVATSTQHTTFAGTLTNLALVGGTIKLSNSVLFDDIPGLIDTWSLLDNYGGTLPSGSYLFDAPLNFGTLAVRKLTAHIASTSFEIGDLFDSRSGLIDTWDDFDGAAVLDCSADLYVSTSPDAVTYGAWTPFMSGEFKCMAAKFRLDLASATNTHNIAVSELSVTARITA